MRVIKISETGGRVLWGGMVRMEKACTVGNSHTRREKDEKDRDSSSRILNLIHSLLIIIL